MANFSRVKAVVREVCATKDGLGMVIVTHKTTLLNVNGMVMIAATIPIPVGILTVEM